MNVFETQSTFTADASSGVTFHQFYFTKSADKTIIEANQKRFFGLEQLSSKCIMLGQKTTEPKRRTYYRTDNVTAPPVGSMISLSGNENTMVAFRVYLQGKSRL